jgi:hypothetical protein
MTVRSYGILFLCICFVLAIAAGAYYFYQQQALVKISEDVDNLTLLTKQDGKIQGNIVFFINKKEQMKTFLKDDNHFQDYYKLLQNILSDSKTDAIIQSMDLTLTKDTDFVISIRDFTTAEKLLDFIESPKFLDNFQSLSLASFSISNSNGSNTYQLSFRGQFIDDLTKKDATKAQ